MYKAKIQIIWKAFLKHENWINVAELVHHAIHYQV